MIEFRYLAPAGALLLFCAAAPAAALAPAPLGSDRDACVRGDGPTFLVRVAGLKDRSGG